ncbi:MAG: hypothetical protein KME06_19820 [Kastovskya adunca ATA6-11-RM4]|nr:hypothetical protein [Kastovskya adunca ATA6-11-RM4]
MQYQTTVGWSLITSGIVTLLLSLVPGSSLWWGIAFLVLGSIALFVRKSDRVPTP